MAIQLNLHSSDSDCLIRYIGRDNSITILLHCPRSNYNSIASLNRSFRHLVRSGELYELRRLNGVIEHCIFFSCQFPEWEGFDPVLQRWMHLPRVTSNCFMWPYKNSFSVGTDLVISCRNDNSILTYRYSMLTNSWTSDVKMNSPRCLFGSASFNKKAIIAGGCDIYGNILKSAELYNSDTKNWEMLPDMKKSRKMSSAVFMDGKFYVIGGIGESDNGLTLLTCAEELNLETRIWREIPNMSPDAIEQNQMPQPVISPLVAVVNNELFAVDLAYLKIKKYEKTRQLWFTVGRLPESELLHFQDLTYGLTLRDCGNQLILIRGSRLTNGGLIEIYSSVPSETGDLQWDLLARKHSAGYVYSCAIMGC